MKRSLFVCLALVLPILIFFHTRGFPTNDEGWPLQAALRLKNGDIPYQDFDYLYNPGVLYINVLAFYLFGTSILSARIMALGNSLLTVLLLFYIARKLKLPKIPTAFLIGIYLFWGPAQINFVWPVMFCLTAGLATGAVYLAFPQSHRQNLLLLTTGVLSAITFILKQNFGLAIFLSNVMFFIIGSKQFLRIRPLFWHACGYSFVIILQLIYFLNNHSLSSYLGQIWYYTYDRIFLQGVFSTSYPWEFPAPLLYKILKTLFYLWPLIISVIALKKSRTLARNTVFFPILCIFYYALSIRPTTDLIHLAPLIALSGISLIIVYHRLLTSPVKLFTSLSVSALIIFGAYNSVFGYYYRWSTPLARQNLFLSLPRSYVWVDNRDYQSLNEISAYFAARTPRDKYILVYNFAPIFYFLLDKTNPTPYDYLHSGALTPVVEQNVSSSLENKAVRHIIVNTDLDTDRSEISRYIRLHYRLDRQINNYTIYAFAN